MRIASCCSGARSGSTTRMFFLEGQQGNEVVEQQLQLLYAGNRPFRVHIHQQKKRPVNGRFLLRYFNGIFLDEGRKLLKGEFMIYHIDRKILCLFLFHDKSITVIA